MRRVWSLLWLAGSVLAFSRSAGACSEAAPCVDAEPMWLAPGPRTWALLSDTGSLAPGKLAGALTAGFRMKPVVLVAPAPNAAGREINLILHTTDLTAGMRVGVGRGMELTLSLPAGLYQRGAGIKGVTHQSAPPIPEQSLHDPRFGFGYALPTVLRGLTAKLRLELKLPLGDQPALMGERSFVTSNTVAFQLRRGHWFLALELGARLRQPSDFFGRRIGTQCVGALGLGYELPRPRLTFTLESYVLRSLAARQQTPDGPAEWLATTRFTPSRMERFSFGVAGGTSIPSQDNAGGWTTGVGAPLFRALLFARWHPEPE